MTHRKLPRVKAFDAPRHGSYEAPSSAYENWHPVKAANDDANTLNIYDQIGESWDGTGVTARLVNSVLRKADGDDVVVNINSPGGDFFEGVTIYNMLREYEGIVNINVIGLAASAASVIAMAADELRVAKAGFLMIHNSWGLVIGNQHDMRDAADTFAVFDKAMAGVYSARSKIAEDEIATLMASDFWMTGEEAVEKGFADAFISADEIVEDEEKAASAKHRIDKALAKQGVPRSERRALYQEMTDTQNAAGSTTQNASDFTGVMKALNDLKSRIEGNTSDENIS